jgi:hemolysin III
MEGLAVMEKTERKKYYTVGEEIANSVAHGVGAALSVAALAILVVSAVGTGEVVKITSFSIYGSTLIVLYLSSTLYHALTNEKAKNVFRYMDHISIYFLIAGTYTPVTLVLLGGAWGWTVFGLSWGLALAGTIFKVLFFGRYEWVSLMIYIFMGWLVVIAIKPMMEVMPFGMFLWFLAGGLFYTLGVIFYAVHKVKFFHFIWHLFVIAGSVAHFFGIIFYLT